MRRSEFEHLIAAAAQVVGETDLVVIGSQAVFGSAPEPPEEMLQSIEVDVYPRDAPGKADYIDGALGDGSQFHAQFGYYAHAVGPETAKAPKGWQDRLLAVEVPARPGSDVEAVAWCLEAHDLVLAKCAAGRDRDWEYARVALLRGLVSAEELQSRVGDMPVTEELRAHIQKMLRYLAAQADLP